MVDALNVRKIASLGAIFVYVYVSRSGRTCSLRINSREAILGHEYL